MPSLHILIVDGGSVSAAAAFGYFSIPTGIDGGALELVTASRPPSMSSSVGMGSSGVLKVLVPPPLTAQAPPPPPIIVTAEGGGGAGSGGEAVELEDEVADS